MEPVTQQREQLENIFGSVRFVYNWGLETKIREYQSSGKSTNVLDLMSRLPSLKAENPWLAESIAQSLQASLRQLDNAYTSFFRKKTGFPRFKSKRGKQSFQIPQDLKVDFEKNRVSIPKIGWVRCHLHRRFDGKIKSATVTKSTTDKYHISILIEEQIDIPPSPPLDESRAIGIDVGVRTLITTSDGRKFENPRHLRKAEKKLKRLQRSLSRRHKGSKRHSKMRKRLALQYERISDRRADHLHKITYALSNESQVDTLCVEDLSIRDMMRNHRLAGSIGDASWNMLFRFLSYKCGWNGKNILSIGRFDPSSKTCHSCGFVNHTLKLSDVRWECPSCGMCHDRDENAAINIRRFAFHHQNLSYKDVADLSAPVPGGTRELTLGKRPQGSRGTEKPQCVVCHEPHCQLPREPQRHHIE